MTEAEHHHAQAKKKDSSKLIKILVLVLLFVAGTLGYLYYNAQKQLQFLSSVQGQEAVTKKEVKQVTDSLGKLTLLPKEEPVIATILDVKALASQSAFYQNAENGDKLVVYPQAQRVYIYSPVKNIIVNAGPLIFNQNQTTRPVRFEVRNGSSTVGAAAKMKEKLEKDNKLVTALSDASRKDYQDSLVVFVNTAVKDDENKEFVEALTKFANSINAKLVKELPQGEAKSEADILIIVGNNQVTSSPVVKPAESPKN